MLWFDTCASRTLQAASIGGTSPRTVAMRGWLDTPPTVPSVTDLPNSNTIVTSGASRFSNGSHDLDAINDGVAVQLKPGLDWDVENPFKQRAQTQQTINRLIQSKD